MPDAIAQPGILTAPMRKFALAATVLAVGFAALLWRLFWFAIGDDLLSYIPLIPAVSVYLAWTQKTELPRQSAPARKAAVLFFGAGAAATAGYLAMAHGGTEPIENCLALGTLGWVLCLT